MSENKIYYKTKEEIFLIKESALLGSKTIAYLYNKIHPGVSTAVLDALAEEYIRDNNAVPAFLGLYGFPASLCISVNEEVVHGIPGKYIIKEGDIVSVDCGVLKSGYYSDQAYTFAVGEVHPSVKKLLSVTKQCLYLGIQEAKLGNRIGDVSFIIQNTAQKNGFGVVRALSGHGVGKFVHEAPQVNNYGKRGSGPVIREGLVIAIEPMINMGTYEVETLEDKWTIVTKDGKLSAHYEHNVAIFDRQTHILSNFSIIEEEIAKYNGFIP
ncbi:MAG: type I methionyl aminopeptidase [Chitinophagaceae bacterium]|nr:type I methionyl aminopeptidase [Chitinophagaceae bacterium]